MTLKTPNQDPATDKPFSQPLTPEQKLYGWAVFDWHLGALVNEPNSSARIKLIAQGLSKLGFMTVFGHPLDHIVTEIVDQQYRIDKGENQFFNPKGLIEALGIYEMFNLSLYLLDGTDRWAQEEDKQAGGKPDSYTINAAVFASRSQSKPRGVVYDVLPSVIEFIANKEGKSLSEEKLRSYENLFLQMVKEKIFPIIDKYNKDQRLSQLEIAYCVHSDSWKRRHNFFADILALYAKKYADVLVALVYEDSMIGNTVEVHNLCDKLTKANIVTKLYLTVEIGRDPVWRDYSLLKDHPTITIAELLNHLGQLQHVARANYRLGSVSAGIHFIFDLLYLPDGNLTPTQKEAMHLIRQGYDGITHRGNTFSYAQ